MQFTTAFFALVPLVAALPSALGLAVRTPGNVDAGFKAACEDIFSTFSGECIQYDSVLRKQLSAFGPDSGQTCFLFACVSVSRVLLARSENEGRRLHRHRIRAITFPGVSNLQTINFNDEASSYHRGDAWLLARGSRRREIEPEGASEGSERIDGSCAAAITLIIQITGIILAFGFHSHPSFVALTVLVLGPPSLFHPSRAHAHTRIRRAQAARVVRSTHTDSVRYIILFGGWDGIEFAGWLGAVLIFSFRLIRFHAGCSTRQRPPRLQILPPSSPHVPAPSCAGVHSLCCGMALILEPAVGAGRTSLRAATCRFGACILLQLWGARRMNVGLRTQSPLQNEHVVLPSFHCTAHRCAFLSGLSSRPALATPYRRRGSYRCIRVWLSALGGVIVRVFIFVHQSTSACSSVPVHRSATTLHNSPFAFSSRPPVGGFDLPALCLRPFVSPSRWEYHLHAHGYFSLCARIHPEIKQTVEPPAAIRVPILPHRRWMRILATWVDAVVGVMKESKPPSQGLNGLAVFVTASPFALWSPLVAPLASFTPAFAFENVLLPACTSLLSTISAIWSACASVGVPT
ncbi:hypothetical protein B0H13DRAFT_2266447 [Mycena leptocephala]|nr:hypothetical protein B0H13DRAFT_2266447 [Mycena leptocephala]